MFERNSKFIRTALILACSFFLASPTFAAFKAADATPTSITLYWTAPGDDGSTGTAGQYDLRYSLSNITSGNWDAATQAIGEPIPSVAGTPESLVVTGLNPGTTYYFAIKAADEIPNWSAMSNVVVKTTEDETTPPSSVATLAIASSGATSITLSWNAPGDDGNSGTASEYDIRYSTSTINSGNWDAATQASGEPSPQPAGSSESFQLTGLQTNTTYFFAMKTADEVPNWSGISNVASGSTSNESTPPAAIANLGASATSQSQVTLTWTAPGDDGNSGTASQYSIRYSTATISEANWNSATPVANPPLPSAAGSFQSMVVGGLTANTDYYFAIKTADEVPNWSALSNVSSTTTLPDATPPSDVGNLIALLPTMTSLTLAWTAPGDDGTNGTADSYDLRYSPLPITDGNWSSASQVSSIPSPSPAGTPESLTVTGLAEGTKYYFALKSADEVPNWSGMSNTTSNTTSSDTIPPASIDDLTASTGVKNGQVDLSWTAPGDDDMNGITTAYEIHYSTDSLTDANWQFAPVYSSPPSPEPAGNGQSLTVASLVPGQMYWFCIRSYDDAANPSEVSNLVSAEAKLEFILAADELAQPSSPKDGAEVTTAHPRLVAANATEGFDNMYRFEISTDTNFFNIVEADIVPEHNGGKTTWKVAVSLRPDQLYYWRVGTNNDGLSPSSSFTVRPFPHAYPNPVRPAQGELATFTDLPSGGELVLVSVSGSIVRQWDNLNGDDLVWDGMNESGSKVASGTYLWSIAGTDKRGKIVVVN